MNNLEVFKNMEFGNIRAVEIDGKLRAVGVDVARALGYAKPDKAITDHCKDDPLTWEVIDNLGRMQNTRIISEGDIYRLIIKAADQSHNPEIKTKAARFEKWIFEEVLQSIRKHGAYITTSKLEELMNDPRTWAKMLTTIAEEREEKERLLGKNENLQKQIEIDKPKVIFADAVSVSDDCILVGELAKILKENGIDVGPNRLFEQLRRDGFLIKRDATDHNMPTQKSMELELFKIKETAVTHSDGRVTISKTAKVTGKGQQYFINYFLTRNGGEDAAN
jgi:anti-repressor protein